MWSGVHPRQYGISIISIVRCPVRSPFNTGYYGASTSLWKDCSTTVCACHIFRRTYCTQVFLLCSEETLSEFDSLCVSTSCQTNKNDLIQLNLCNATIWNGDDNSDEWEYCDKYGFTCVFLDGGLSWFPCAWSPNSAWFFIFFPLRTSVSTWHSTAIIPGDFVAGMETVAFENLQLELLIICQRLVAQVK